MKEGIYVSLDGEMMHIEVIERNDLAVRVHNRHGFIWMFMDDVKLYFKLWEYVCPL